MNDDVTCFADQENVAPADMPFCASLTIILLYNTRGKGSTNSTASKGQLQSDVSSGTAQKTTSLAYGKTAFFQLSQATPRPSPPGRPPSFTPLVATAGDRSSDSSGPSLRRTEMVPTRKAR